MSPVDADVAIAGGGLAGSALGGVLAQAGLRVVIVERESRFRDRIRGETTWPWGRAEIERLGLLDVFRSVGALDLCRMHVYESGELAHTIEIEPRPGLTYQHAPLQDALLGWAETQGATILRPARVVGVVDGERPTVEWANDSGTGSIRSRLVVAATGRSSSARTWTGGVLAADPEHHRFGGVAIRGAAFADECLLIGQKTPEQALLFHLGSGLARLYLRSFDEIIRSRTLDRSFDALLAYVRPLFGAGVLDRAEQVGPLAFFTNRVTWSTKLAGHHVVLIGDVAGTADPSGGHGTSLVFRDVRVLRDLLIEMDDWQQAIDEFERVRWAYYDVIRARDRWYGQVAAEPGPLGEERRRSQALAREHDPSLGGFASIEFTGPDGLTADEMHRQLYFGERISRAGELVRS